MYLPTLRRNILFLSVFDIYQFFGIREREREKKRRIRNVGTMISFNSRFLHLFFSNRILLSHQEGKKVHKSPHRKKNNNNNSKREQQQQQRQEPGGFFGPSDKHLDHTIEMVNKEKICIKKNIFYHNNKHVTSRTSVCPGFLLLLF